MANFQLTPPNTCALLDFGSSGLLYVPESTGYSATISTPDTIVSFLEFTNPEDAAAAALVIDPSYNTTQILGRLTLNPVNVSDPEQSAYIGDDLTLNCEYECTDPSATVTYSWSGPTGDLGVDGPSLTLDNVSEAYNGTYTCVAYASNPLNQAVSLPPNSFTLTVTPAPNPSGVINTGRSGASALDLAPSYFPTLQNMPDGVTEADLQLYVPGTDTVISYDPFLPEPFKFDSMGNCFAPGDFRLVVRVASTAQVLATVYPPAGPNKNILWLYNPVVPS